MAQNDIVDIDPVLEELEQIQLSELFPERQAIADRTYSGKRFGDSFKNFLVEELGVPSTILDLAVGPQGGFRERFYSPGQGMDPLGLPPGSPIQFRGFRELLEPTDVGSRVARESGVKENPPTEISRIAAYIPRDSYDIGVQNLIRNYYGDNFDVPDNFDYEFQREPFNNQVIYRDPTDSELKFINPPGIDWGNFSASMAPIAAEITGVLAGAGAGTVGAPIPGVNPASGAIVGEVLASYLWRYNNLNELANQGLLDPSYDETKINYQAMKDAGMTALFSIGGAGAYRLLTKAFGTGSIFPGIKEEDFTKAFDELKAGADTPAKQKVVETATVPEVMATQDLQPIIASGLQAEIARAAGRGDKRAGQVVAKLEAGETAKLEAIEETLEDAAGVMPTKTGPIREQLDELQPEIVLRKEELGKGMKSEFDDTIDPKVMEVEKTIQNARGTFDTNINNLLDETVEPEVALNALRKTVADISKGEKALPGTGKGFKIKLNKLLASNKTEEEILDKVLQLAKTSDRDFFKSFLNDSEYVESAVLLRRALKNKYKKSMTVDESGNLMPLTPDQHQRFITDNKNIIEDLFDPADAKIFEDASLLGRQLNREVRSNEKTIDELRRLPWNSEANANPEFIFKNTWTTQKEGITKTRKVKDIIGDNQELADEYRLMILNDMRKQTDNFKGTKIVDYIDNYGAMLEQWYPKDVVKNLREYSNLIKSMKTKQGAVFDDPALIELMNKAARVYVGFFTAPGRALSASKQLLGMHKNAKFVDLMLSPQKYRDAIKMRNILLDPKVMDIVKGLSRTYGRETSLVSGFDEPETGQIETADPVLLNQPIEELEITELNRGGEPLMELKY